MMKTNEKRQESSWMLEVGTFLLIAITVTKSSSHSMGDGFLLYTCIFVCRCAQKLTLEKLNVKLRDSFLKMGIIGVAALIWMVVRLLDE